ncbi:MAG: hypothetical protein ACC645_16745 [Pirellulales bacterium]
MTAGNTIYLDDDASGIGWFFDETPADDAEFRVVDKVFEALEDGPAYGRVDLLTVIMHEFGHLLGEDDRDSSSDRDDLMSGRLAPGVRRRALSDPLDDASGLHDVAWNPLED